MLNFLEPSAFERLRNALADRPALEPPARLLLAALILVAFLIIVECARLHQAEQRASSREVERDQLARRGETFRSGVEALRSRQAEVEAALELRRDASRRMIQIARVGNVLPPTIGLTNLRDAGEVWHLEGRAQAVTDVGDALKRIQPLLKPRGRRVLNVHRERGAGFVVFELELGMDEP